MCKKLKIEVLRSTLEKPRVALPPGARLIGEEKHEGM